MIEKTLLIFAHPALEKSRANRALIEGIRETESVTIHDLYEEYPDFLIDVEREKSLLMEHQRVIWQHPFYWYSTPSLLKEWFDTVLEFGWAYGNGGDALKGKRASSVITTGGGKDTYTREGSNRYTMEELLRPIEQTATLCGMRYTDPLVFHQVLNMGKSELEEAVSQYRNWLQNAD
jgi:glutathione-regulated potassium-efflux system ancillary protein KefG